ncbi:hypothetical protein R6Q59_023454 [Mikania micrantha]
MNRICSWKPVCDAFQKKLSLWKAACLSMGGRLILINSVLSSLPLYFFSLFKAPEGILESLEKLRRNFLWGGVAEKKKIHWARWDLVTLPKKYGGLGVGNLKDMNLALLAKWWWRYKTEPEKLWRRVIDAIHVSIRVPEFMPCKNIISGTWKNITKVDSRLSDCNIPLRRLIKGVVGDGCSISFWLDTWVGEHPLAEAYPILFDMEAVKSCSVADRIRWVGGNIQFNWSWESHTVPLEVMELVENCTNLVKSVNYSGGLDHWKWMADSSGVFHVNSIRKLCNSRYQQSDRLIMQWNKGVPIKVNILAWKAHLDRLPTADALAKRGIHVDSSICALCGDCHESTSHLFTACYIANMIWSGITNWCNLQLPIFVFSVEDLLQLHQKIHGSARKKDAFHVVILTAFWCIWKLRNDSIFRGRRRSYRGLMEEIKALSFFWFNNRARWGSITWEAWCGFGL